MKLTDPQLRALRFLGEKQRSVTPAMIGEAMTRDRKHPLAPQGAGRIGGAMARRLIDKGLAVDASHDRGGFPAYRISAKGRRVLAIDPI